MPQANPSPKIVEPGQVATLSVLGDTYVLLATGAETGGQFAAVEITSPPQGGPPPHVHRREDEAFYVLDGAFEIRVGDRTIRATPGAFVFAPRDIPHAFKCVSSTPGKLHVTIVLAGFERFFQDAAAQWAAAPPTLEQVRALAARYGVEIL